MAAGRSLKTLVSRRRRIDEEGEEEDGPVMVEDSQSDGSVLSDLEDDAEDASSAAPTDEPAHSTGESAQAKPEATANGTKAKKARKPKKKTGGKKQGSEQVAETPKQQTSFKAAADTEAMMNGLKIDDQAQEPAMDFENTNGNNATAAAPPIANGSSARPPERKRSEHEDIRKQRDSNPAFTPNRGNFFMHDTRGQQNGQGLVPARGGFQARGRGRGGPFVGGPFSPANQMRQQDKAAEQLWKHDLHESINEEPAALTTPAQIKADSPQEDQIDSARLFPKPAVSQRQAPPPVISFSSTTLVGKVQIRVLLPGMVKAVTYSEVPIKRYIRLPNHRPPLRRDKPVRVSLPDHPVKYIFPSTERSFIFIPRQMRPNQSGFGRYSNQRNAGGYGYSSRRTSMYGGSVYSASVAPSRRSSLAREISRENAYSPAMSHYSGFQPPNRPVVRLPHGQQYHSAAVSPAGPLSGQHTPTAQVYTYPLPQQPTFQGTPTTTMHQPRPQKAISVSGIESPAVLQQAPQDQQQMPQHQQPFSNQLPAHMIQPPPQFGHQGQPSYYSPNQGYAFPQQAPQAGTPLSGIPEHAIHAQAFQPPMQQYYYPPAPVPMYQQYPPQQQQGYYMGPPQQPPPYGYPPQAPPQQAPEQPPPPPPQMQSPEGSQQAPSGMVAHESNGMVFYLPASEAQQQPEQHYQPAESFVPNYAMPGLPPPTPAPEQAYYYPVMSSSGTMPEMSSAGYYQQ